MRLRPIAKITKMKSEKCKGTIWKIFERNGTYKIAKTATTVLPSVMYRALLPESKICIKLLCQERLTKMSDIEANTMEIKASVRASISPLFE